VLDHLHRYLCAWLAPVLCFTAEEAWTARFGEDTSVHLALFPTPPEAWRDDALGAKWDRVRAIRRRVTIPIEEARAAKTIGASLQAAVTLPLATEEAGLLAEADWTEIAIVSALRVTPGAAEAMATITPAAGEKCARCWKILPEVGSVAAHPTLCERCADAVESGLVCR
jgi:isoleucyl-tRNA synthetase